MLLKELKIQNRQGSLLSMPFEDISTGFIVKEIEGLSPVKATLVSSSFANLDGEYFQSSKRETRNILLHLELKPDYAHGSVKELRDQLYKYFMPKSSIKLIFSMFDKFAISVPDQTFELQIDAKVESFDSNLFTNDPVVDISLMCFDPDFYIAESVIFESETVNGPEESLLNYKGNIETGVIFKLFLNRYVNRFQLYNRVPGEAFMAVDFQGPSYSLEDGDVLTISSIVGSKGVTLTRAGVDYSILYALTPASAWLMLYSGENYIRVQNSEGDPIPYSIEYITKYGGL